MHEISGDAQSSGVLLLILLVPITLYGLSIRQRDRREVQAPTTRSLPEPVTSGHGSMLADPLLEFFGPQHARPAAATASAAGMRTPPAPRFQPRPGLTGRSTMSTPLAGRSAFDGADGQLAPQAGSGRPPGSRPRPAVPPGQVQPPPVVAVGAGPIVHHAHVSGTPPWEPAQRPATDLPWAVIPPQPAAPRQNGPDTSVIPPPPDSVWDAGPAPKSAPRSAPRPTSRPDRPRASAPPPSLFGPAPAGRRQGRPAGAGSVPASAPVPADAGPGLAGPKGLGLAGPKGPGPTSWQDLPGAEPQRPASRWRRSADRKSDGERGPIFVWTPMGSHDNKR
jgi:hypothetical protein